MQEPIVKTFFSLFELTFSLIFDISHPCEIRTRIAQTQDSLDTKYWQPFWIKSHLLIWANPGLFWDLFITKVFFKYQLQQMQWQSIWHLRTLLTCIVFTQQCYWVKVAWHDCHYAQAELERRFTTIFLKLNRRYARAMFSIFLNDNFVYLSFSPTCVIRLRLHFCNKNSFTSDFYSHPPILKLECSLAIAGR